MVIMLTPSTAKEKKAIREAVVMLGLLSQWKTLIQGHFHGQRQSHHESWWFMTSSWFAVSLVKAEQAISWVNFLSWLWLLWTCNRNMLVSSASTLLPREPWPGVTQQWEDQISQIKYIAQLGCLGKQGCRVHWVHVSFSNLSTIASGMGRQKLLCHKPRIKSCLHKGLLVMV